MSPISRPPPPELDSSQDVGDVVGLFPWFSSIKDLYSLPST